MTAGIYLVSACGSAEEFVAAFRRYADKTGLFVPIANPLPQGKKGRIALTLVDGGVMLEGEAEIIQSSAKSPIHGRAGIQLKFVDLDEPSKTVLAELEKARLAMKPAPLSVPPRPADVPATPRPTPPPTGGRIDAANALAECIAIGDTSKLEDAGPPKAGAKFVVPSIPAFGSPARPKTPSTPPEGISAPPAPTAPAVGKLTSMGMPALRPPAESGPVKVEPRLDPAPPPKTTAAFDAAWGEEGAAPAAPSAKVGSAPTAAPAAPIAKTGSAPSGATKAPTAADNGGLPPPKAPSKTRMTQLGFPVVKLPADGPPKATTLGVVPLHADEPTATTAAPPTPAPPILPDRSADKAAKPPLPQPTPTRTKAPTAPPRNPTPHVPLPVAKLPAKPAPMLSDDGADEKTDLTSTPLEPTAGESGRILIESKPPLEDPIPEARPQRSGGMRASEIMAAVTSDDWTMTPDAPAPTVLAGDKRTPAIEEPTPGPTPTGDWTMSLDPAAGWSKPEQVATPPADKPTKIERPKPALQTPATGNPVKAVSSDKPIEVQAWEDKPTSIGEKIEIDATLMEPAEPVPALDPSEQPPGNGSGSFGAMTEQMAAASSDGFAAASSGGMNVAPDGSAPGMAMMSPPAFEPPHMPDATGPEAAFAPPLPLPPPPPLPQEIPIGFAPTLLPGQMNVPPGSPPMQPPAMPLQYAIAQPGDLYRSDAMPIAPPRSNKRLIVIVAAVLLVVGVAVVLALTMSHGKKKQVVEKHTGSAAAVVVMGGSGSAQPAVVMPDAGGGAVVVTPPVADAAAQEAVAPPKTDTCTVEVTTTPAGAEVSLDDKTVLGTTPAKLALPCGQVTKLNIKKAKFLGVVRSVTPTPAGVKVAVGLGVATFVLKITSTPAGATIFVGGKSKGVTPAAVQLPAFQTVKITVAKDGYAPDTSNVVLKANGQSHHVTLKKAGRRSSSDSHGLKGI